MNKFSLILNTVRYLKPIQIHYQLWYRIRRILRKLIGYKYSLSKKSTPIPIKLKEFIPKYTSFENYRFTFLNQSCTFKEHDIYWDYKQFGKLWEYNLNYFDFLHQPGMKKDQAEQLIIDFISKLNNNSTALEPYPIALRGINWIKFLSQVATYSVPDFSNSLYAQYKILYDNLEYHLLGNHLLENGFSLLFGAFYLKDEKFYHKASKIINIELSEQILKDGAHFELSPMYHQIILDRMLDCINLLQNNQRFKDQEALLNCITEKATKMIHWINCLTFSNGRIPLLNDSATGIAPSADQLNQYAIRLGLLEEATIRGIGSKPCNLSSSGYRRFNGTNYECILDIGQIGPSYQPGHAHADTFNFVLNVNNQPYIIDPGISTYEANEIRQKERSTSSHNTVTINDYDSSGVWSSFRVANRANVTIIKESDRNIIAKHNGFKKLNTIHQREWEFDIENIYITDTLNGAVVEGKAHIWLAPTLKPEISDNLVKIKNIILTFENAQKVELIKVKIPDGYNKHEDNYKIEIKFRHRLKTIFTFN